MPVSVESPSLLRMVRPRFEILVRKIHQGEEQQAVQLLDEIFHDVSTEVEQLHQHKVSHDRIDRLIDEMRHGFTLMDKRFEAMDKRFEDMQKYMDKRFEQVDKRFEVMQTYMDSRFEALTKRIDRFMIWSFASTVTIAGATIAILKLT